MPRTPVDYNNTVIYKIQAIDKPELIYVGHTTDFVRRKNDHKNISNNASDANRKSKYKLYIMIKENGGWDMFKMIQIKEFPCKDKREAEAEEDKCMMELKASMNSCRSFSGLTPQEYSIQYRETHKERKKLIDAKYREANKDRLLAHKYSKFECECGVTVVLHHKARHRRSMFHINTMNSKLV